MQEAVDEYVAVTVRCASGEYIGHAFVGTGEPTTAKSENPTTPSWPTALKPCGSRRLGDSSIRKALLHLAQDLRRKLGVAYNPR